MIERHSKQNLNLLDILKDKDRKNEYIIIDDVEVKITSQRYPVFKKSKTCCVCGLEASFLALERRDGERYHINMYGLLNGEEMLFTKDHIRPKSRGGKNIQSNYQTMCETCNIEKGNNI